MAEHRRTAEQLGCQCEVCPLGAFWRSRNSFSPVMPEGSADKSKLVVIGERPGPQEVKYGRPQIGASGQLLERSVNRLGLLREDLYIDNAILCPVPGEDLEAFNSEYVSKINQTIKLKNRKLDKEHRIPRVPTPQEACRPHIRHLVDEAARVGLPIIALGKLGWWSITGKNNAIEKVRGSFNTYVRIPETIGEAEGVESQSEEQARDLAALTTWASKRAGMLTEPGEAADRLFGVLPRIKVSATINPAFALRKASYRAVLERDLERVLRWHTATLRWADPTPSILSDHPTPGQLRDFLFGLLSEPDLVIPDPDDPSGGTPASWWSWDVEATREGEMLSKLRTIGIRNLRTNQSMIVPWLSIDGKTGFAPSYGGANLTLRNPLPPDRVEAVRHGVEWWADGSFQGFHYTAEEGWEISNILRDFFRSRLRKKVGHYSGMYDGTVVERHLGVILEGGIDQILLMRIWNSELPRSLYFAGTMLTDVPSWKNAEDERSIANDPRTYRELAIYNNVDLAVTGITGPVFVTHAVVNRKWPIAQLDHKVQSICREMRMTGMWVDEGVRARLEEESREKLAKERKVIAEIAGKVWAKKYEEAIREDASAAKRWRDFNPNSTAMLATLLYDDWKIPLTRLTASNKPSTDEDAIRIMLTTKGMIDGGAPNGEQRAFLNAVWRQRGFLKDLSTVILAYRKRSAGGLVFEDGVLRPGYGAHIPATGRMSSFDPNCFDGETEILTEQGWVRFDQLAERGGTSAGGLKVAQFHPEGHTIDFTAVDNYIEHDHDGPMVQIRSEQTDLFVTPDHRCLLYRRGRRGKPDRLVVVPAAEYPDGECKQLHAGNYVGGRGILGGSEDWVRFLVMVQADGSFTPSGVTLMFVKDRKVERCKMLLDSLQIPYTTGGYSRGEGREDVKRIYFNWSHAEEALAVLGDQKMFGPWLLQMTPSQIDAFVDELWHWDGCFTRKSQYSSSEKVNSDWAQAIIVLAGKQRASQRMYQNSTPNARPNWIVDVSTKPFSYTSNREHTTAHWSGKVYCVSVPSSYIVVRRNGKVSVTGNCQNVKLILRKMIRPRPGHLFLMADYDQIELRMFSAMAGIKVYLDAFKDPKGDPHAVTAKLIYGDEFVQAVEEYERIGKAATRYVSLRRFAKTFVYCVLYGGTEQTAYEAVSKATDPDTGELLFPNMTYHQVATCVRTWMRNAPEVQVYWDKVWKGCELNGYVEEPILGRRRDMPVFERNESLNLAIQGAAGIVMSQGLVRCREAFPPDYERGLGIVNQMHDAATIEVREEDAERLRPVMEDCLTASYPDKVPGVTFTTKAKVCIDFAETDHRNAEAFAETVSKMEKAATEVIGIGSTRNQEKAQPMMARARTALEELRALTARGPGDREAQFELHAVESVIGKIRKAVEKVPA